MVHCLYDSRDHRAWSVGQKVLDPRTGEVIKGHARLGSLRGRHDVLLGLGLLAPPTLGQSDATREAAIERAVLARHRQLGAHETGHTLGLAHNYMGTVACPASTQTLGGGGCDASVMDCEYKPTLCTL